jgi:hypothetical protein
MSCLNIGMALRVNPSTTYHAGEDQFTHWNGLSTRQGRMGGEVFAGLYALYAGLVFLVAAGLVFAPVLHRLLHKFHVNTTAVC